MSEKQSQKNRKAPDEKKKNRGHRINHISNMKCLDCICGIESPEGIWCIKLKMIPDRKAVKKCRNYLPRALIEGDEYG
jgi:hypothetical protein